MFLNDPTAFRHAEEVRFTDERRRGRMWDGFIGQPGLALQRDRAVLDRFKAAVRERFESKNVHVDIFDRQRPTFDGDDCALIQATVYRDGRLDDFLEFVNGALDRRPRRPVYEVALTYEPATGVIEVVANDRESREDFVRLFARELLGSEFKQERHPWRRYDLGILLRPYDFPTDPEVSSSSAGMPSPAKPPCWEPMAGPSMIWWRSGKREAVPPHVAGRIPNQRRRRLRHRIVVNAHRINRAKCQNGRSAARNRISGSSKRRIPRTERPRLSNSSAIAFRGFGLAPIRDIQVLCPMQRGALGARSLNADLQKALNPKPSARIEKFGSVFASGDKIMQSENDYDREVFNGDLGTVLRVDENEGLLVASFDGREIEYPLRELDAFLPAYATTIHKSQGSEYPAVVVTLAMQHYTMLARNLVYTAVTRGKCLVVIVGQRRAMAIVVRSGAGRRRWTPLGEWMKV